MATTSAQFGVVQWLLLAQLVPSQAKSLCCPLPQRALFRVSLCTSTTQGYKRPQAGAHTLATPAASFSSSSLSIAPTTTCASSARSAPIPQVAHPGWTTLLHASRAQQTSLMEVGICTTHIFHSLCETLRPTRSVDSVG